MRIGWPARQRVESRPRVARAVEAARLVREGIMSEPASAGARRHFEAVERAAATGPLKKVMRRGGPGVSAHALLGEAAGGPERGRPARAGWGRGRGHLARRAGGDP